jgi:hypothetical protein
MLHRTPEEWARIEARGIDRERLDAFTDEDIEQQAREDDMPIGEDDDVDRHRFVAIGRRAAYGSRAGRSIAPTS